jgi:folate-binding protein YgfZ
VIVACDTPEAHVGQWASEALQVAAWRPRFGFETDHRTIPHEVDWLRTAVHPNKGCYRGQDTVARVHNLARRCAPATARSATSRRPPATTSSGRSRSPWSSGRSRPTPTWSPDGVAAAQELVVGV